MYHKENAYIALFFGFFRILPKVRTISSIMPSRPKATAGKSLDRIMKLPMYQFWAWFWGLHASIGFGRVYSCLRPFACSCPYSVCRIRFYEIRVCRNVS